MNSTRPDVYTNSTSPSTEIIIYLEMFLFILNILFGLIHSYVIWLITTGSKSKIASEFFILNLSVCEIGNSMNSFFFIMSAVFPCLTALVTFFQGLGITGRPLFQCLMCVERYLAVVHPVTFLKFKPLRYRVICCTAAWIITLGSCSCSWTILNPRNMKAYGCFFLLHFFFFFCIKLFCLVAVLRGLKQSEPGERMRERKEENHTKKRAFHLILITTVYMAIIHIPFAIVVLYSLLTKYNYEYLFPGLVCYVLGGFVQPVLYLHRAGKLSCHCTS